MLSRYLDAGTLITHVDDTPLASAEIFENGWTVPPSDKEPEGWCLERTTLCKDARQQNNILIALQWNRRIVARDLCQSYPLSLVSEL